MSGVTLPARCGISALVTSDDRVDYLVEAGLNSATALKLLLGSA